MIFKYLHHQQLATYVNYNTIMRKIILLFIILSSTSSYGQLRQSQLDSTFMRLNTSYIASGLLFDKAFHFSNMRRYTGVADTLTILQGWKQMYAEIYNMYFNRTNKVSLDGLNANGAAKRKSTKSIPLLIMNYKYDILKQDAAERGLVTIQNEQIYDNTARTESPYTQSRVFAVAPFLRKADTTSYKFYIGSDFYFTNDNTSITSIQIDFGDGYGFRSVSFGQTIAINYPNITSDKIIKVRFKVGTQTLLSSSKILASTCNGNFPSFNTVYSVNASIPYNGEFGQAFAWTRFGNGNTTGTIQKPIIFVEGIDFGSDYNHSQGRSGDFGWCELWGANLDPAEGFPELRNMPDLLNALLGRGFDIVLFDFNDGADYIQKNAFSISAIFKEYTLRHPFSKSKTRNSFGSKHGRASSALCSCLYGKK